MIRNLYSVLDSTGRRRLTTLISLNVALAAVQGLAFVGLAAVLGALFDGDLDGAWGWTWWLLAACVVHGVLLVASTLLGYDLGSSVISSLHRLLGDHLARLPLGWFAGARSGGVGYLVSKGVIDVVSGMAHLLRPVLNALVTPVVIVIATLTVDWRLGLALLVGGVACIAASKGVNAIVARADHVTHADSTRASNRVIEYAQTQPVLRAFGQSGNRYELLDDALRTARGSQRRLMIAGGMSFSGYLLVVQAVLTVVLVLGVHLALGGDLGIAELVTLLVLATRFVEPLIAAGDLAASLKLSGSALNRMQDLLATPVLAESEQTPELDTRAPAVELRDVTFGYGGKPVLQGVSLTVPAKSLTALVGPSGAGKSTVLRLAARFFEAEEGSVLVGGHDVREQSTAHLMGQLSIVAQDVYLFDGTLADNVRLGRPDATAEELAEVARAARVDEIVDRLPQGWDTRVGEGGSSLSGGERQRISIARALLKDAPIVLLDEATAALDPENEAAVQDALAALTADRTVIVVAHRLQTVVGADQIVVLAAGRVVERGRHAELVDAGGIYEEFWRERSRATGWRLVPAGSETTEG